MSVTTIDSDHALNPDWTWSERIAKIRTLLLRGATIGEPMASLILDQLQAETARADRAEAKIDAVRALHVTYNEGGLTCKGCDEGLDVSYPCPTLLTLDGCCPESPAPDGGAA